MNRADFDKLDVLGQLAYINELLKNGESLRNISVKLSISKTTIRDRFKKLGYSFNGDTRQYTKLYHRNNTEVFKSIKVEKHKSCKNNTLIKNNIETKSFKKFNIMNNDLIELVNAKVDILNMLKYYKNNASQLDINSIPQDFQKNIVNKSIKVYKPIFDEFIDFCEKNKGIKKQDMVSLALYEFISKYK